MLSSTVEDGALSLTLGRTRPFSQYQDSVIGERIEVYAVSCSFMQSPICYTCPNVANTEADRAGCPVRVELQISICDAGFHFL